MTEPTTQHCRPLAGQPSPSMCTVRFDTHSAGGISVNDFICAAKVDALLP